MTIFNTWSNFYLSKLELEKLFPGKYFYKIRRDFLACNELKLSSDEIKEVQKKIWWSKKIFSLLQESLYEDQVLEKIFEELKNFREKKEWKMRVWINFFSSLWKKVEGDWVKKIIQECKWVISWIRFVNKNFNNLEDVLSRKQVVEKWGLEITALEDENTWRYILIKTESVQDVDFYSKRDYEKPQRSARVWMLPPKLAQMLINFATDSEKENKSIWDPFCWTWTILLEAGLMWFEKIIWSDLSEEMVEYSKLNFEYFESWKIFEEKKNKNTRDEKFLEENKNFKSERKFSKEWEKFLKKYKWEKEIFCHDVKKMKDIKVDCVVTEWYLWQNMSSFVSKWDIRDTDEILSEIWENALYNFAKNWIKKIVFCLPCYPQKWGGKLFLKKTLDILKNSLYNELAWKNIYWRKWQFVHRDIHILELK